MNFNYHLLFKYIIIGDANTGKSSLLLRFIDNKFSQNYQSTLGVQFGSKIVTIGPTIVKAMIWDTAGQESFKSIIRSYYKNAIIALLVFDVTNAYSFQNLQKWRTEITNSSHEQIRIVVVGNKIDNVDKRVISKDKLLQFANAHKMMYFQTSAKSNLNVNDIFIEPARQLITDIETKKLVMNGNESMGIKIGNPQLLSSEKSSIQISIKSRQKQKCKC